MLGAVVAGAAAYGLASIVSPTYRGDAKLIVGPINADPDTFEASGALTRTYAELAVSRPVLRHAIQATGAEMSVDDLNDRLTASGDDISRIVTIEVKGSDPTLTPRLANAISQRLSQLSRSDAAGKTKSGGLVQVVQPAERPTEPVEPRVPIVVLLAALAGAVVAGMVALVRESSAHGP